MSLSRLEPLYISHIALDHKTNLVFPPQAYRHRGSTSVQIARIVALTVVASSFILGSFILASSWVSARSSCHQLEQLDAMLEKELALEGRAYGNDALMAVSVLGSVC